MSGFCYFFLVAAIIAAAEAKKEKIGSCTQTYKWKYPTSDLGPLQIYGIKYLYKENSKNNRAFKVRLYPSKRICADVKADEIAVNEDGWIVVDCDKQPMDDRYAELEIDGGLGYCGKKIWLIADKKSEKPKEPQCPGNSKRRGGVCKCNGGYEMVSNHCLPVCSPNARRVSRGCKCNGGFQMVGKNCVKSCPANGRRVGNNCRCNGGYQMVGAQCLRACPSQSRRIGTVCKCNNGWRMQGNRCVQARDTCRGQDYFYCHRGRSDCNGHDIRSRHGLNTHDCQKACSKDCNCKSIQSWSRGSHRTCWLKRIECSPGQLNHSGVGNDYVKRVRGQSCPRGRG